MSLYFKGFSNIIKKQHSELLYLKPLISYFWIKIFQILSVLNQSASQQESSGMNGHTTVKAF